METIMESSISEEAKRRRARWFYLMATLSILLPFFAILVLSKVLVGYTKGEVRTTIKQNFTLVVPHPKPPHHVGLCRHIMETILHEEQRKRSEVDGKIPDEWDAFPQFLLNCPTIKYDGKKEKFVYRGTDVEAPLPGTPA